MFNSSILFNTDINCSITPNIKTMYSLQEFYNINNDISNYQLPDITIQLINKINNQVCSPSYIKTPIFKKKFYNKNSINLDNDIAIKNKKKKCKSKNISDTDWQLIRNFESTTIDKNEDGINKDLNRIRILLNKLCDDNFDDILFEIKYKMNEIINYASNTDLEEIGNSIFEIGSHNLFYSKLYAKIYSSLIKDYDIMKSIFDINYKKFYDVICSIETADPNTDYEKFCIINKKNETRRAICAFMANLFNENIISIDNIYNNLKYFINQFNLHIKTPNNLMITEEISEVIFIIIKNSIHNIYSYPNLFNDIKDIIDNITDYNIKLYPSLNNKIIFKFMDIMDIIDELDN
jgi:hypothetical protein